MSSLSLIICALLVSLSAYLSASEIAIFSLSRFQLRSLKENFRPIHRRIKRLLGDPGGLLVSILVINEVVNITLSAIIAEAVAHAAIPIPYFLRAVPRWAYDALLGILMTAPVVLIFCEVTPKVVAARMNHLVAPLTSGPLTLLYNAMMPVRFLLQGLLNLVSRKTSTASAAPGQALDMPERRRVPREDTDTTILRESEFMLMVEQGQKEGTIHESEVELIRNVFELDDTVVSEVATPLSQVQTISIHTTFKGALQMLRHQRFSRIPVVGASRREVVGILYAKDLLRAKLQPELSTSTVESIMRKPLFVSPGTRLNALFRRFKQLKTHMAVVQQDSGSTEVLGIVTMSDVLDALFDDLLPDEEDALAREKA